MEHFGTLKKYSGFFIIPLFWLAYFMDFGISQVHDRLLDSAALLAPDLVFAAKVILTMLLTTAAILLGYGLLVCVSALFGSSILLGAAAICLLCFGVAGLYKEAEAVPFQTVNVFWQLGSLAAGIWLLELIGRVRIPDAQSFGRP